MRPCKKHIDGIPVIQNQAEWIHGMKKCHKSCIWKCEHKIKYIVNISGFSERTTYKKWLITMLLTKFEIECYVPCNVEEFDTK